MKKIVLILSLIIAVSCSKSEKSPVKEKSNKTTFVTELEAITVSVDPAANFPTPTLDFSNIDFKDKVIQELNIRNISTTTNLSMTAVDFDLSLISPFIIESNSCLNTTIEPRKYCSIKFSITHSSSLQSDQLVSSSIKIKGSSISLNAVLKQDLTDYDAPIQDISVSSLNLNFGTVKAGLPKDLNLIVKNNSLESKTILVTPLSEDNMSIISNGCSTLASRRSCSIRLRYSATQDDSIVDLDLFKVANNQIKYSVNSFLPTVENPEILLSIDSVENSQDITTTQPVGANFTISFINNSISTFTGPIVGKTSHPSIIVDSISCPTGLARSRTCSLEYTLNSEIAPLGLSQQSIWIQSGTVASEKMILNLNIQAPQCNLQNANILNAASVSGNIVDGCIVETCLQNYTKEDNLCKFLANISIVSGNNQSQVYSSLLTQPLIAEVKTPAGIPMVGVPVTWQVTSNNGTLSNTASITDAQGRISSSYLLGSSPGANAVRVSVDSVLSFVDFSLTGALAPFSQVWGFDVGSSLDYDLSGSLEYSDGKVKLKTLDQTDDSNTALGFGAGSLKGVAWDETLSHLRLNSDSVCNGSLTNCSELAPDWTPRVSNLIGYWKFNNNLNATVGTDGTATSPSFAGNVKMGSHALVTTGGYQAVKVGDISGLNNVSKFTVSGWFKQNVLDVRGGLFGKILNATNLIRARTWDDGNLYSYVYRGSQSLGYFDYSAYVKAGQWFHYTMVFNGTLSGNAARLKVYIDGVEVPQLYTGTIPALAPDTSGVEFEISENFLQAPASLVVSESLNGQSDEFAIWTEALTNAEIKRIYEIQKVRFSGNIISRAIDSENPVGNWTEFSWKTNIPYAKGLPDFISGVQSETSSFYPDISPNLMSGNIGLYHLDEPVGTTGANTIIDRSSASKHGTPVNVILGEEGKLFRSARSTGSSGYITLGSSSNFRQTSLFSVSFWAKGSGNLMGAGASGGQGYGGFIVGTDASLSFAWTPVNPGSDRSFTCTQKGIAGEWNHYAMIVNFAGNSATCFVNGIQSSGSLNSPVATWTPVTNLYNNGLNDSIGGRFINSWFPFNGSYDEIAIWNRSLSLTEVRQIYRRGANRIKYQVRSCPTQNCSGVEWKGPDNTPNTYFSEIYNITNQSVNPSGIIGITHPKIYFSNFSNLVANNRYFQYKAILENEDTNGLCNYGSGSVNCSPELSSVEISPITRYSAINPFVVNNVPVNFYTLNSFTQSLGSGCPAGVVYNISLDKNTWYYHNGTNWAVSNNDSQANSSSAINSNVSSIPSEIGIGSFYFKAYLKSDGSSSCELDSVSISGGQ